MLKGLESNLELSGIDVGASETLSEEKILEDNENEHGDLPNVSNKI